MLWVLFFLRRDNAGRAVKCAFFHVRWWTSRSYQSIKKAVKESQVRMLVYVKRAGVVVGEEWLCCAEFEEAALGYT